MSLNGNEVLAAVSAWTLIILAVIAGLVKIAVALAGLIQQVKTLFKTQENHEARITKQDEQLTTVALATTAQPSASVSASGTVAVDQTGGGTSI